MSSKVQVELALNSDRFSSAIRSDIYSVNLFTNAVQRAGSAIKNLEKPIKLGIKEEVLSLEKTVKSFLSDANNSIETMLKNLIDVNDNIKAINSSYEKVSAIEGNSQRSTSNGEKGKVSKSISGNRQNVLFVYNNQKAEEKKGPTIENFAQKFRDLAGTMNTNQCSCNQGEGLKTKSKTEKNSKTSSEKPNKAKASNTKDNLTKCICSCSNVAGKGKSNGKGKKRKKNGRKKNSPPKNTVNGGKTKGKGGAVNQPKGKGKGNKEVSSITKEANKSEKAISKLGKNGKKSFAGLGKAFKVFKHGFKAVPIVGQVLTVIDIISTLKSAWDNNFLGIKDITSSVTEFVKNKFKSLGEAFSNFMKKFGDFAVNNAQGFIDFKKNPIKAIKSLATTGNIYGDGGIIYEEPKWKPKANGKPKAFGQRVIPYDNFPILAHQGESLLTANETRRIGSGSVVVSKLADTLVVREDADIDKIASVLVSKLDKVRFNMG